MQKQLLTLTFLTISLKAITFDNAVKLDINKDEDNNLHPDIYLPLKWNNSLSTSFSYKTDKTITENETIVNTTSSDKDTTIEHTLTRINILNYNTQNENSKYYFGFGLQNESFDKTQTGFATTGATNINFNHNIDIEVNSIYLKSDMVFYSKNLDTKIELNIIPTSKLEVTQNTLLSDGVNSTGKGSSKETLDLSYDLSLNFISKTDSIVDIGIEGSYRFLPLKYDLQLTNSDDTYTTKNYDVEEKITAFTAKLYFNLKTFGGFMPTLGYSSEKTDGINKLDNTTYEETKKKIVFGFNKRF